MPDRRAAGNAVTGAGGRRRAPAQWRLAAWYAALFLTIGLFMPWWPAWLESRGLDAGEIGVLLALTTWAKVVAAPLATGLADRLGRRRPVMIALSFAALAAFRLYAAADGFAAMAVAALLLGVCFSPLLPLGESLTMLAARARRFDYGRVRLWGSLAFIAGAWGGGALPGAGVDSTPTLVSAAAGLTALACLAAPDARAPPSRGAFAGLGALLRRPAFLLFLATASLIQGSHAAYYAFATLHWRAAGLGAPVIGALWAEGVAAEVALFAASGRLLRRAGEARLFALAAAAATARWAIMAATADLAALAAAQALHAGSFALTHLAAMRFIQRAAPAAYSATAQGLHSALAMGAVMALLTMAAGGLYEASPAGAFLAMAGLSALAGAVAAALARAAARERKRRPQ